MINDRVNKSYSSTYVGIRRRELFRFNSLTKLPWISIIITVEISGIVRGGYRVSAGTLEGLPAFPSLSRAAC